MRLLFTFMQAGRGYIYTVVPVKNIKPTYIISVRSLYHILVVISILMKMNLHAKIKFLNNVKND